MGTLSNVPFLGGYLEQGQLNDQQGANDLARFKEVGSLMDRAQARHEADKLRMLVAKAGGDIPTAVKALVQHGSPQALELATKFHSMLPKPEEAYTLPAGARRYGPNGEMIAESPPVPAKEVNKGKWGEPYDLNGVAVQRNDLTGEIKTAASRPPVTRINMPPQIQPLMQVVGPDGQPRYVERRDAIGMMPAGAGSKMEKIQSGKGEVDKSIVTLKTAIDSLYEGGGVSSPSKSSISNIGSWIGNSAVGQTVGEMAGTENQKYRGIISQARPLLLRSIMEATGMSARQMDSNAELKLWLSVATDPGKGREANLLALHNISAKYGGGGFLSQEEVEAYGGKQMSSGKIAQPANKPAQPAAQPQVKEVTLDDLYDTAKSSGKTLDEVKRAFIAKGFKIKGL